MTMAPIRPRGVIDLNADVGEAEDPLGIATELDLLEVVTTVHVACGGHAGDEASMRRMVSAAAKEGVAIGAHPSYPDREAFGRTSMAMPLSDLAQSVEQQLLRLRQVATNLGVSVVSVKPHGALYNDAAQDPKCTMAIIDGVRRAFDGQALPLFVLMAGTVAAQTAVALQCQVVGEGFCDRSYESNGTLTSRQHEGALTTDPEEAADRALRLVTEHRVATRQEGWLEVEPESLCVHGDTPGAVAMARRVRFVLESNQFAVVAPVFFPL
jgi:5-oxoprolinase (ATP-hydrolysing) subunit A